MYLLDGFKDEYHHGPNKFRDVSGLDVLGDDPTLSDSNQRPFALADWTPSVFSEQHYVVCCALVQLNYLSFFLFLVKLPLFFFVFS